MAVAPTAIPTIRRWTRRRLPRNATAALVCSGALTALAACSPPPQQFWQGYAEGEYQRLAVPFAGNLQTLFVARGQQVGAGTQLFVLEHAAEDAQLAEAQARLAATEARRANLAGGQRKPQLDAIRAQIDTARAARDLAARQLKQQQDLRAAGFIAQARLDEARSRLDSATAQLDEAMAQHRAANQSLGREAELAAAEAEIAAARAAVAQVRWRLEQKQASASATALVHDTYFTPGEWVPAGAPVLSLLPPGNIKLRIYVAETDLATLKAGDRVSAGCDGCGAPITATVSYISPQAEYTPPVLYSKQARAKLVFLVEARTVPEDAARLKPGQPLDIAPLQ